MLSETLLKRKDAGRDRSTMRRQPLFMVFRMVKYLPAVSNLAIHPVASLTSSSWSSYKQNQSRVRCRPPCNLPCRPNRSEKDEQIKEEGEITGSRGKGSIREAGGKGRIIIWFFFFFFFFFFLRSGLLFCGDEGIGHRILSLGGREG